MITVDHVTKQYTIGTVQARYGTLRDAVPNVMRAMTRRFRAGAASRRTVINALNDVSFRVRAGEAVGIIGRNGAGKSTLLKVLGRITQPTRGAIDLYGRVGSLLEVGTGFHPELSGRENVVLSGAILGMRRAEILRQFDAIVAFAEVERFIDTPVKFYSSGMYMRLAFAVAAHLQPEILLIDEVLAVGDSNFQKRCLGKMEEFRSIGRTVLFVSHNMASVVRLCQRVILMQDGAVVADGPADQVTRRYLQSGTGSPAERVWPDVAGAPGDGIARLHAVRIRDERGRIAPTIDIRKSFDVEVEGAADGHASDRVDSLRQRRRDHAARQQRLQQPCVVAHAARAGPRPLHVPPARQLPRRGTAVHRCRRLQLQPRSGPRARIRRRVVPDRRSQRRRRRPGRICRQLAWRRSADARMACRTDPHGRCGFHDK